MREIKNIVFDIGNVLIRFDPTEWLVRNYGQDELAMKVLFKEVFGSEEWKMLDQGLISDEEAAEKITARIPDYRKDVERILYEWENFLIGELPVSVYFLRKFKEKGYNLYALSNYPQRGFENTERYYPFFELFDGKVVSYAHQEMKPEHRIYEILLEQYDLNPAECVFIDDTLANIHAAEELGMEGIHFHHNNQLMELYMRLSK
ncbi:MAG: HAD family phosphatase [Clostridia bacterium]|jgi:putative hydrolase of the HAD superfamily|uniref:HAD family phosphatase n=1 Tax=Proteiniclasticum aestuarii TaxID=2817862 RepID=A0A939H6J8_9CLOT|nr:HAD family phosphatase [Proteiniclasticum aestuarii]MBO1265187.1 HAD family phosphatase [Proteiniclasticum aestuarii]NCC78715.1 HAD family phosphatase [Clostridia bacterium]